MEYRINYFAAADNRVLRAFYNVLNAITPCHLSVTDRDRVPQVFYGRLYTLDGTSDGKELGGVAGREPWGIGLIGTELNGQLGKDPKATVTYVNGPPKSSSAGFRKVTPKEEKLLLAALGGK